MRRFPWFAALVVLGMGGFLAWVALRPRAPVPPSLPAPAAPREAAAERDALEELDRIGEFAGTAGNFENAPEVVRRYQAFMNRHAGHRWELEAGRRLQGYEARCDAFAKPELAELLRRDAGLRAEQRYAELLRAYGAFPQKFLDTTPTGRAVKERKAEVERLAREGYVREREEAVKLLTQGFVEEALGRVTLMERYAEDDKLAEVAALKARVEREGREAAARVRKEVADRYLKLDGDFKRAMARREAAAATAVVRAFLDRAWPEVERRFVFSEKVDYGALRKALDEGRPADVIAITDPGVTEEERPGAAEAALLDLRAAAFLDLFLRDVHVEYRKAVESRVPLEVPTLGKGFFEKRGEKTVFVAEGGGTVARDLVEDDFAYLAMRAGPPDAGRHARAGFFYYSSDQGLHARAYEHLTKARELGARGLRPYLADLAATVQSERGREIEAKLGAAGTYVERKQWGPAKQVLEGLLEGYGDHPLAREKRAEIERMRNQALQGLVAQKEYAQIYRGKVDPLEGKTLRVSYDFSDKAQFEAFEPVVNEGNLRLRGRWRLERGGLESGYETSALRWKTRVKGDLIVEYDLTPHEEPQNIVLAIYNDRGAWSHYALVCGFDWVGRSDGDKANTAEDHFGMPRTCVIKYPVAVDKGRWMLAAHWQNWITRLVGKASMPWQPVQGKTARVRLERRGPAIRVEADGKPIWSGEDGDYSEGHLLFFTDCRCRIDALAITFTPP